MYSELLLIFYSKNDFFSFDDQNIFNFQIKSFYFQI